MKDEFAIKLSIQTILSTNYKMEQLRKRSIPLYFNDKIINKKPGEGPFNAILK